MESVQSCDADEGKVVSFERYAELLQGYEMSVACKIDLENERTKLNDHIQELELKLEMEKLENEKLKGENMDIMMKQSRGKKKQPTQYNAYNMPQLPSWHPVLKKLRELMEENKSLRRQFCTEKRRREEMEAEIEDLAQSLFQESSKMVSQEARKAAKLEEEKKQLVTELADTKQRMEIEGDSLKQMISKLALNTSPSSSPSPKFPKWNEKRRSILNPAISKLKTQSQSMYHLRKVLSQDFSLRFLEPEGPPVPEEASSEEDVPHDNEDDAEYLKFQLPKDNEMLAVSLEEFEDFITRVKAQSQQSSHHPLLPGPLGDKILREIKPCLSFKKGNLVKDKEVGLFDFFTKKEELSFSKLDQSLTDNTLEIEKEIPKRSTRAETKRKHSSVKLRSRSATTSSSLSPKRRKKLKREGRSNSIQGHAELYPNTHCSACHLSKPMFRLRFNCKEKSGIEMLICIHCRERIISVANLFAFLRNVQAGVLFTHDSPPLFREFLKHRLLIQRARILD